jgi:sugar lactone lactonase YvrE
VDAAGDIYIADTNNQRVRKVDASGIITTVAGNGTGGYSGDGGAATSAEIYSPRAVALDSAGDVYIADNGNQRVRMVSAAGIISTVAGNGSGGCSSGDGGQATSATIQNPNGVSVDSAGNLYIAASNCAVRRVDTSGIIHTVAGVCQAGYAGDGGPATSAQLNGPSGVAVDSAGNVYISDYSNQRIRKVSIAGTITTIAGGATGDGGSAALAGLYSASGVARDAAGNIYIADTNYHRVRKMAVDGNITTYAGNGTSGFSGDGGVATNAQLRTPYGVALDSAGNLYIADTGNARIRKVDTSGNIATVAGNGGCCYSGDSGPATSANLNWAMGAAVDSSGNLYIADTNNSRIRKVTPAGTITTLAGTGTSGYSGDGGAAASAQLAYPNGVAVDSSGNVYIADGGNNRIRKVDTSGNIATIAGNGTCCYSGDGGAATSAQLNYPDSVAVDSAGDVYIADTNNLRVRKVNAAGTIMTIAGRGGSGDSGDGAAATNATFRSPRGLALDASGNVYVADQSNNAIRLLSPSLTTAVLTVQSAHTGSFTAGQSGAAYAVTVANAVSAGPSSGAVTVTESVPAGLTLVSMSGTGWTCASLPTCTRSDALGGGASYPAIAVTVNVSATAPVQLTNVVTVSGGGAPVGSGRTSLALRLPVRRPRRCWCRRPTGRQAFR